MYRMVVAESPANAVAAHVRHLRAKARIRRVMLTTGAPVPGTASQEE